ncbi:MAG: hypothetical protein LBG19_00805 [Prevotellaceae bacterium]|jgi:hypothetical protein|nr:hypothetical protein [Prevotellaceae bacterium]
MRKQFIYIFLIATTVLFTGCNKYLDEVPDNRTEINSVEKVVELLASSYPRSCFAAMVNSRVDFVSDKGSGGNEHRNNTDSFFWNDIREYFARFS